MANIDNAVKSNMGVSDGMFSLIVLRPMLTEGQGSSKATYGEPILLDKTVATITHTPSTSEGSLALNGGVVRSSKTGLGDLSMTVTALSQEVLKAMMIGITEDPETGALMYDFSNMTGRKMQISYGETFSSGITRCYKFMAVKPTLPGSTVNATDPENISLAANGTITLSPEAGSAGEDAMITKDFKSDDAEGIFNFITEAYPPKASASNLTVSTFNPVSGGTVTASGTIKVTFNTDVTEGIQYYTEILKSTSDATYEKIPAEDLEITLDSDDAKIVNIKHKTGFTASDKLILNIKEGAQAANGDTLKNTAVATYTVSGM